LTLKSAPVLPVQVQLAATRTKPQLATATPEPRSRRAIKTLGSLTLLDHLKVIESKERGKLGEGSEYLIIPSQNVR
jgi:hypothetical protein